MLRLISVFLLVFLSTSAVLAQPCVNFLAESMVPQGGVWAVTVGPADGYVVQGVTLSYKLVGDTGVVMTGTRRPNLRQVDTVVNTVNYRLPEFQRLLVIDFADQPAGIYRLEVVLELAGQDALFCGKSATLLVNHGGVPPPADSQEGLWVTPVNRMESHPIGGNQLQFSGLVPRGAKTFLLQHREVGTLLVPSEAVGLRYERGTSDVFHVGTYSFKVPNHMDFRRPIFLLTIGSDGRQSSAVVWDPSNPRALCCGGFAR